MGRLVIFKNNTMQIRVIEDENGKVWFSARDVAEAMGHKWYGLETVRHVPGQWRRMESVSAVTGLKDILCLSEKGLYWFLNRSDKSTAIPFQTWIAEEVVPSMSRQRDPPEA